MRSSFVLIVLCPLLLFAACDSDHAVDNEVPDYGVSAGTSTSELVLTPNEQQMLDEVHESSARMNERMAHIQQTWEEVQPEMDAFFNQVERDTMLCSVFAGELACQVQIDGLEPFDLSFSRESGGLISATYAGVEYSLERDDVGFVDAYHTSFLLEGESAELSIFGDTQSFTVGVWVNNSRPSTIEELVKDTLPKTGGESLGSVGCIRLQDEITYLCS